jgi:hypothetical protein
MTTAALPLIELDDNGVAWISGTGVHSALIRYCAAERAQALSAASSGIVIH